VRARPNAPAQAGKGARYTWRSLYRKPLRTSLCYLSAVGFLCLWSKRIGAHHAVQPQNVRPADAGDGFEGAARRDSHGGQPFCERPRPERPLSRGG